MLDARWMSTHAKPDLATALILVGIELDPQLLRVHMSLFLCAAVQAIFFYSVNLHLKLLASTHILVGHDLVAWQPCTRQSQVHFDKLSLMCGIGFALRVENFTLNQEIVHSHNASVLAAANQG